MKTKDEIIDLLCKQYQKTFEPVNGKSITEYAFEAGFRKCMEIMRDEIEVLTHQNFKYAETLKYSKNNSEIILNTFMDAYEQGFERGKSGLGLFNIQEESAVEYYRKLTIE